MLAATIDDLVTVSPKTHISVLKFKSLLARAGGEGAEALKEILVGIVSEAIRRALWGS
jgi:hypothetical protein